MTWIAVLSGSLACYLLKLAGLSVPRRVLDDKRVRRIAALLPAWSLRCPARGCRSRC